MSPKESALADFRLSGIIFGVARPSAIVNGETVSVGDRIRGATVVRITESSVTLRINGLLRTYTLRQAKAGNLTPLRRN